MCRCERIGCPFWLNGLGEEGCFEKLKELCFARAVNPVAYQGFLDSGKLADKTDIVDEAKGDGAGRKLLGESITSEGILKCVGCAVACLGGSTNHCNDRAGHDEKLEGEMNGRFVKIDGSLDLRSKDCFLLLK